MLTIQDFTPVTEWGHTRCTYQNETAVVELDEKQLVPENAAFAGEVLAAYAAALPRIAAAFAADGFFSEIYAGVDVDEIPARLGRPVIRVFSGGNGMLSYPEHTLDDMHILDMEFAGVLQELGPVGIDG